MSIAQSAPTLDPYQELSPQFLLNPYPVFERLRKEAPIYKSPTAERWLISRYNDVATILRDDRFSSERFSAASGGLALMQDPRFDRLRKSYSNWMLLRDDPDHARLRGLVSKAFTPGMIAGLRDSIANIADALLTEMEAKASLDLVADLAYPLPVTVIAAMLGVPVADHHKFGPWSRTLTAANDVVLKQDKLAAAADALGGLYEYFGRMIELRRQDPREDLISALVAAEESGNSLSVDEVVDNCILLLFAGHETTVNLIGNGTLALLQHPQALALLRSDPEMIKPAVEELLRYDSPVQMFRRLVKEDLNFGGHQMKKSDVVVLIIGSANRDPLQFPDADSLCLDRSDNKHLAFGLGAHYCLGGPLARLEAEIAFSKLFSRFPTLQLASDKLEYMESAGLRGLKFLNLKP